MSCTKSVFNIKISQLSLLASTATPRPHSTRTVIPSCSICIINTTTAPSVPLEFCLSLCVVSIIHTAHLQLRYEQNCVTWAH